ncbi:hypothetical protein [Anaerosporobacter sp.]|uniref:hypothetical protein n=1 Tax=Anaerosporobacter sp. TaxID=1872529 RepID=UPI00286ED73C|nr:hypothetical protein [Anaerosporobacter sp.]
MSFSREIQEKINRFAAEQSKNYLQDAEMTYMEKLRKKGGEAKGKLNRNISRFKNRSEQSIEAQNDLILYISDYMNDLMSQGLSEEDAFAKASETMKFESGSKQTTDIEKRFQEYYENMDPAQHELIGMQYGGLTLIGLTVGGLVGYIASGGRTAFLGGGWIDTLIGLGVGVLIGVGIALIGHALILSRTKR